MEKLIYALWRDDVRDPDAFREALVERLGPALTGVAGVHGVRVAAADSDVADAAARRMISHPPAPDAALSLWVDHAGAAAAWEPLIADQVKRMSAYLVAEAEPLVSQRAHPSQPGERVYGMCHVVFLRKPEAQSKEEWFAVWKDSHTQVAIDTQSTFGYRQNVVVRAMGEDVLPFDAIVEEHFPPEAMASDHAFYATGGDEALLQARTATMMESCARFIDFEHIDVIPMSEYVIREPFA
jgi:hypothetical protein